MYEKIVAGVIVVAVIAAFVRLRMKRKNRGTSDGQYSGSTRRNPSKPPEDS